MLVKTLHQFKQINLTIASSALKKLQFHFWYLTEEMVLLCLFGNCVADEEKELLKPCFKEKGIMLQSPERKRKMENRSFQKK